MNQLMIDQNRKLEVAKVLGYGVARRADDSWVIIDCSDGIKYSIDPEKGWNTKWTYEDSIKAMWALVLSEHDLYLHKKGGIYRKQDERPLIDTEITVVNYEHIHPHARAPGCRSKAEWITPGRFVKIME